MKRILSTLISFIFISTQVFAFVPQPTPNIVGSTGLIRMPSADVIPYKNFSFGLDTGSNHMTDKFALQYKMTIGTFQGMELGVVGMDDSTGYLREGVFVNMKYSLITDNSPYPLLMAIGVENLASFNKSDVYMVATRYIANGSKLHFGFLGDFPGDRFRPLGAIGYDTPVFGERVYLLIDMFAGEKVFQLDGGIRWYMNDTVNINMSVVNVLADKDTPVENYKDQKMFLVGFSWINPL